MGIASLSSDAVPTKTLTPQEPLVETLRVALAKDVILVLTNPKDKTFLVTWLIKEWSWNIREKVGSIVFLVANEKQVELWKDFFRRTTGNDKVRNVTLANSYHAIGCSWLSIALLFYYRSLICGE